MRISNYLMIGALSLLAAPLSARDALLRDLTVEQTSAAQVMAPSGAFRLSFTADRADATYVIGETVRLTLASSEDAYVTVLSIGPTGRVTQLFPNAHQPDNRIFADRPVEIAGGATGARIAATGPAGAELVKVIASSKPVTVVAESQLSRGVFRNVEGGVATVLRDLQLVADQAAQSDVKLVFANFALHTVAARRPHHSCAHSFVVVPEQDSSYDRTSAIQTSAMTMRSVVAPHALAR